jgi:hypothetical protein
VSTSRRKKGKNKESTAAGPGFLVLTFPFLVARIAPALSVGACVSKLLNSAGPNRNCYVFRRADLVRYFDKVASS